MTELDAELGPLALELIEEYGKAMIYTPYADATYNPQTSQASAAGDPKPVKGLIESYSAYSRGNSGGLIEGADRKITLAAAAFDEAPTPSDTLEFDGSTYTIVTVDAVFSGELAALYVAQARQ